jgi:hypothetical protein
MSPDPDQTRYLKMEIEIDATTHAIIERFAQKMKPLGKEPVSVPYIAGMLLEEFALTLQRSGLKDDADQKEYRHN